MSEEYNMGYHLKCLLWTGGLYIEIWKAIEFCRLHSEYYGPYGQVEWYIGNLCVNK